MPDIFPVVPTDWSESHNEGRDLLDEADQAQMAGDREGCIDLIQRLFESFDRQASRFARAAAALMIGLSIS